MLGDALKKRINELSCASENKNASNAFWAILRDIAKEDIIANFPQKIDSDIAVPVYYDILCENIEKIPQYFKEKLKSNKQERFRVINRNIFTSNAFHPDGLANQKGIKATRAINEDRKGDKIIYQGDKEYVNNK